MKKNGEKRIKAEKPRKKISFAALIAIVMSALSFVIIAAMASVLSSSFGDLLSRSAITGVESAAEQIALSVQRQIDETIETLDILKRKLKTDAAALDVAANSALELDRNINAIIVYDEGGNILRSWSKRELKSTYSKNLSDYRAQAERTSIIFRRFTCRIFSRAGFRGCLRLVLPVSDSVYGKVCFSRILPCSPFRKRWIMRESATGGIAILQTYPAETFITRGAN